MGGGWTADGYLLNVLVTRRVLGEGWLEAGASGCSCSPVVDPGAEVRMASG